MMKRVFSCFLALAPVVAGCGDSSDDAAPAAGGSGGAQDDAAVEAEPDAGQEAGEEGGQDAASEQTPADSGPDAPQGDCSQPPRDFWIYDLSVMPPKYVQVAASCQAQGDHVYLYVADDIWNAKMNLTDVGGVMNAFEKSTPADSSKGIYDVATGAFGTPTDVDKDGHIFLLYYEIKGYQGNQFDGFIRREDMLGGTKSNGAEVLYLDGVRNDPADEYMLGVAAHEFEHMIMLNHNPSQAGWLDETLGETSMVACGYYGDLDAWVKPDFAKNPTQSLTSEPPNFNYGAGFLFGGYLLERFGEQFITSVASSSDKGIAALDSSFTSLGKSDTFKSVLPDWAAANFLDVPALQDGRFGYKAFDVPTMASSAAAVPSAAATYNVEPYSAKYVVYTVTGAASSTLSLALQSSTQANLAFRWAAYPDGDKASAQVGAFTMAAGDDTLTVAGVGGSVNRVMLAVVEVGGAKSSVVVTPSLP